MFKNYIKTAWRNLWKNRFYSSINVLGLAIGLAVSIMILLWVQHESGYDKFHADADQIYKVNAHIGSGASMQAWEGVPSPLALLARQSIPGVITAVRIMKRWDELKFELGDKKFEEKQSAYTDPAYFRLFNFPLLYGDLNQPFKDDQSIVVSESEARKFFGTADVVGKVLQSGGESFSISAVMKDAPDNTRFTYNMIFPLSLYAKHFTGNGNWKTIDDDLGNYQYEVYLRLQKGIEPGKTAEKLTLLYNQKKNDFGKDHFFTLQSLPTVHLVAVDGNESNLQLVHVFAAVAILILLIASINYVNLSTARSMLRAKEVSMRKITGASKAQLFFQFMVETAVLFAVAAVLSFGIIYALMPLYNQLSGKNLSLSLSNNNVWMVTCFSIVFILALGGIYPALLLSSTKPLQALKGKLAMGIGAASFRKTLVVVQFIFSIVLITSTLVISRQIKYMKEKDPGYNREYVFSAPVNADMHNHTDELRHELLSNTAIRGLTLSDAGVVGVNGTTGDTYWEGKPADLSFLVHVNGIDANYIPVLQMKIIDGRNFNDDRDSAHFILNETAVKQSGIQDPIGKSFTLWQTKGTIIGVVKDYNYASLKDPVEPCIFYYEKAGWHMYVKSTRADMPRALSAVQAFWKKYNADTPFQYSFLDSDYEQLYQTEQKTATLFNVFSLVTIFICCLGLFGLVTFMAYTRTKEIGIRKVLGASVLNITALMAKDFLLLVVLAFLVACPLAWYAMHAWLQDYHYRINLGAGIFLTAGILAVLIALITISFRAVKAAVTNPVKSLRTE